MEFSQPAGMRTCRAPVLDSKNSSKMRVRSWTGSRTDDTCFAVLRKCEMVLEAIDCSFKHDRLLQKQWDANLAGVLHGNQHLLCLIVTACICAYMSAVAFL